MTADGRRRESHLRLVVDRIEEPVDVVSWVDCYVAAILRLERVDALTSIPGEAA